MSERDYTHRDLCTMTSGLLQGFHEIAGKERSDLDQETVEEIAEQFARKHGEVGADTPTPDFLD